MPVVDLHHADTECLLQADGHSPVNYQLSLIKLRPLGRSEHRGQAVAQGGRSRNSLASGVLFLDSDGTSSENKG